MVDPFSIKKTFSEGRENSFLELLILFFLIKIHFWESKIVKEAALSQFLSAWKRNGKLGTVEIWIYQHLCTRVGCCLAAAGFQEDDKKSYSAGSRNFRRFLINKNFRHDNQKITKNYCFQKMTFEIHTFLFQLDQNWASWDWTVPLQIWVLPELRFSSSSTQPGCSRQELITIIPTKIWKFENSGLIFVCISENTWK